MQAKASLAALLADRGEQARANALVAEILRQDPLQPEALARTARPSLI
ncbi:MAG: hypothetical protein FD149_1486 [Rhodospirillaceae bacterium]|nr:MAG: hypothetical protein FD149_1486 [Rhodospirillaceae bacterium]